MTVREEKVKARAGKEQRNEVEAERYQKCVKELLERIMKTVKEVQPIQMLYFMLNAVPATMNDASMKMEMSREGWDRSDMKYNTSRSDQGSAQDKVIRKLHPTMTPRAYVRSTTRLADGGEVEDGGGR